MRLSGRKSSSGDDDVFAFSFVVIVLIVVVVVVAESVVDVVRHSQYCKSCANNVT